MPPKVIRWLAAPWMPASSSRLDGAALDRLIASPPF
jgi:hypothetical protein